MFMISIRYSKKVFIILLVFSMAFLFIMVGKINSATFEYALCTNVSIVDCARACVVQSSSCSGPSCANGGGCTTTPKVDQYRIKSGYGPKVSICVEVGYAATCSGTFTAVNEYGTDYGMCAGPLCVPPTSPLCNTTVEEASCGDITYWVDGECADYICA